MARRTGRPKEAFVEVKLRIPKSRLALADATRKTLCMTRNRYFDHLLDLGSMALDRHRTAEDVAALQFHLWELLRLGRDGCLDPDVAQAISETIDDLARQFTHELRFSE